MVRKEIVAEEVARLMRNTKNIRNIGIVAHVDHGKCVSGSTRIILADGRAIEARALFKMIAESGKLVKEGNELIFSAKESGLKVVSLNKQTGRLEIKPLEYAWKLKGGKVLRIALRNGVTITTTPEHRYVTLSTGLGEKRADELALGDSIACAKNLPIQCWSENALKEFLLTAAARDSFYVYLNETFWALIMRELKVLGQSELERLFTGSKKERVIASLKKRCLRLSHLLAICTRFGIPPAAAYDGIQSIVYRGGKNARCGRDAKPMRLPKDFVGFFYLVGLLFGDVYKDKLVADKLVAGKQQLAITFANELEKLGINQTYRNNLPSTAEVSAGSRTGLRTGSRTGSRTLLKLLERVFNYPTSKKSHALHATDFLFAAPNACVAAFLRAYFDCDGTVEKARWAVSLASASERMLMDVQLLLLRFNIASIRQGNTLYIAGASLKHFVEKVGFTLQEKQEKALALMNGISGSHVLDAAPLGSVALESAPLGGVALGSVALESAPLESVPLQSVALGVLRGAPSMAGIASNYCEYETHGVRPTINSMSRVGAQLQNNFLEALCGEELAFIEVASITEGFEEEVFDFTVADNHTFVADGVIIHNTTLSDTLLARAGLISKELAGEQRALDYEELEQQRGITIKAANISLGFTYADADYLINLIDTPGHVDFGGHVTRAMRAVDGVILVIDAVEMIMPQTETVLRQAMRERVKPVLFVNKIDRLINELKLNPAQIQERLARIIAGVNSLIDAYAPAEFKDAWKINVEKGNVAFGSAFYKWAISFPAMRRTGLSFGELFKLCAEERHSELQAKAPLDEVILEMVVTHLPNPIDAQRYRVPVIWHGDLESEHGAAMLTCNAMGKACLMITAIAVDPHAGEVAVGRLYSGTLRKGSELYLASRYATEKLQGVAVYMGPDRVLVDEVPAGNIVAAIGLREVFAGETASEGAMEPFERIKHYAEPVVTKSIEAKNPRDLLKLIEVLRRFEKEDPTLRVEINQETGEHLISGMGELHLEIVEWKIENERGVPITTGMPIVVYQEAIRQPSPILEGRSPNRHNRFKVSVEPLEQGVVKAIEDGVIHEKVKGKELVEKLVSAGMARDEARNVLDIYGKNIFIDATRGVQYLQEVKESLIRGFEDAMRDGPLAREKCTGFKVKLRDALIHVDPAHRGPAQIIPAIRRPIYACALSSDIHLLEPKQKLLVSTPAEFMSAVIALLQGRRGQLLQMRAEGQAMVIEAKVPVAEMFGFSSEIRGATQGRAVWYYEYAGYEPLPRELQDGVVRAIRKRKGEPETPPEPKDFLE